jgi:hypothetical protein
MPLDPILGTVLAGAVGGGLAIIGGTINRRQEEKRALMEFAIKTAIENWRQVAEKAEILKMARHEYGLNPMDGYLIRMLALVQILQRRKFSADDIRKGLSELEAVGKALDEHLAKRPHEKKSTNVT